MITRATRAAESIFDSPTFGKWAAKMRGDPALDGLTVMEFYRTWGYISSEKDFLVDSLEFFVVEAPEIMESRAIYCTESSGSGSCERIRKWYGLWRSIARSYYPPNLASKSEMMLEREDRFIFVGCGKLVGRLSADTLLLLSSKNGCHSSFLYLSSPTGLSEGEILPLLEQVYDGLLQQGPPSDTPVPFYARFDLRPLFETMPKGDYIMTVWNFGDGLACHLFGKG